MLASFTFLFSC